MSEIGEGPGRAVVVGTGLIGASVGLALSRAGWRVSGLDRDPARLEAARTRGAIVAEGMDEEADLVVVATPAAGVVGAVRASLAVVGPRAIVTDVAGVKGDIVAAVDDPRYVGGHPMAGSELEGPEGADVDLFVGATWVLTPDERTDPLAFARLCAIVSSLGADVLAVSPRRHDELVAVVSHVPHLVAAALMCVAAEASEPSALFRLAAGGFRDMTRIAAGHPGIWRDICAANAEAILAALGALEGELATLRRLVAARDGDGLVALLERARGARRRVPSRSATPDALAEVNVLVDDRPGSVAAITTTAGRLGVNLYDVEIAHSAESPRGRLSMVVDAGEGATLRDALAAEGYVVTVQALG